MMPGLAVLGVLCKPELTKHAALGDTFFRVYRRDCHFEQSNAWLTRHNFQRHQMEWLRGPHCRTGRHTLLDFGQGGMPVEPVVI